jgi:hypothetical protein
MRAILRDVRDATHNLRRSPGFTAAVAKLGENVKIDVCRGSILLSVPASAA